MNRERCFCRVAYQNMAESIFLIKIKLINFFQTVSFTCFFTEIIIHFKERCVKNLRSLGCHFSVGRNPLATGCKHVQLNQNSLAYEMRTRGNERVSVRQGYGYGGRYGTHNEANLLKTARTCCSLEA
jgi:hypothetical protein